MKIITSLALCVLVAFSALPLSAQAVLTGRLLAPRYPGATDVKYMTAILGFSTLDGSGHQTSSHRTWEMEPAGWFFLPGSAGNHTMLFSTPAKFMRPIVRTNIYARNGETVDGPLSPQFDFAVFDESGWDSRPASRYYQVFTARGTSVTSVGFKLVHDGVDGEGHGSQNLMVSIHRKTDGTPDTWPRVGPEMPVLDVDCGGPKNRSWSAGWNSGEVRTVPGETYAVRLRAENPDGVFQAFWSDGREGLGDCYRIDSEGAGWQGKNLWMSVGSDSDGLLIPYNKRVHKEFGEFGGFAAKWGQTYVAQGRSLAGVILYGAASGVQPSMNRQRVAVRVRKAGPNGAPVGIEKIAIGNGTYTGDSSWGTYGVAFAPGEVPLVPGEKYVIEFESIENFETLHGFVNIKGMVSDDRPGFNPYIKITPDTYPLGNALKNGTEQMDFDLDMQVIEYAQNANNWNKSVVRRNLLTNGDMLLGRPSDDEFQGGEPIGWERFSIDPDTTHFYGVDPHDPPNRILRVWAAGDVYKTADGGFMQQVNGLDNLETYRLAGKVRSSFAVDEKRQLFVGFDPTGQTDDPEADTIVWTILPSLSGHWVDYLSDPIRPAEDSISVWLRGRSTINVDYPLKADFDRFSLMKVNTGIPGR